MRKIWIIIGIITAPITIPLAYSLIAYMVLLVLGFHPGAIGTELAEKLVKKDGNPKECLQIIHPIPHIFSPTAGEQRSNCVYEYAKLSKDPTACELLLPSRYGWSCLGASEEPNQRWCWFDFGPNPPQVGRRNVHASFEQCHNIDELQQSRCCELADVLYVNRTISCKQFGNAPIELQNQCLELLARRDRNITLCEQITSDNLRASCEVAVKALLSKSKSL